MWSYTRRVVTIQTSSNVDSHLFNYLLGVIINLYCIYYLFILIYLLIVIYLFSVLFAFFAGCWGGGGWRRWHQQNVCQFTTIVSNCSLFFSHCSSTVFTFVGDVEMAPSNIGVDLLFFMILIFALFFIVLVTQHNWCQLTTCRHGWFNSLVNPFLSLYQSKSDVCWTYVLTLFFQITKICVFVHYC